jgi:Domain of unknown function (DUF4386)
MATHTAKRVPMDRMRKTALVAGGLYLLTFISSIPALALKGPALDHVDFILGVGSGASVVWAGILDLICAVAGIGTAVALFRVTKHYSRTSAIGFLATRTIEGAIITVGVVSLFALVSMRDAGAVGTDAASLVETGTSLVSLHDWTFLLGPGFMAGMNALFLGSVMYRSRLVPRIIPTVGLIAAPIILTSAVLMMFGVYDHGSPWSAITTLPVALWEVSLGVWLVVKGFRRSPVTDGTTTSDRPDYRYVAA